MKTLIMITGFKRSGKDTMGNYLEKKYGYVKTQPFACFKEPMGKLLGFTNEQMNGSLKEVEDKRWGMSPREFYQEFGTDLMKTELSRLLPNFGKVTGNNLWARVFKENLKTLPDGKYVVCDWRFEEELTELTNDAELMKDWNILPVKITSLGRTGENKDIHISEIGISSLPVSFVIENNDTLKDFEDLIDEFMTYLKITKGL